MSKLFAFVLVCGMALASLGNAGEILSSVDASTLPKNKMTQAGLYLSPADAHTALTNDQSIVFIDVRDPVEISFVGHPKGVDAIVPLRIVTHEFKAKAGKYAAKNNPNFVKEVEAVVAREGGGKDTAIFFICRSGSRSAAAGRMMIKAGYNNVWNLVEGFEGDMDKKTVTRSVNGWRNAGLPWTYKIPAKAGWSAPAN